MLFTPEERGVALQSRDGKWGVLGSWNFTGQLRNDPWKLLAGDAQLGGSREDFMIGLQTRELGLEEAEGHPLCRGQRSFASAAHIPVPVL